MSISEGYISSCVECPNFVRAEYGGKAVGNCAAYSKTVFVAGISPAEHLVDIAQSCPSAGIKVDLVPAPTSFEAFAPDKGVTPDPLGCDALSSCTSCTHFATDAMAPAGGHTPMSSCRAKGTFVDPVTDCKSCPFAKKGLHSTTVVLLNSVIGTPSEAGKFPTPGAGEAGSTGKVTAKAARRRSSMINFDPLTYTSDMELREADKGKIMSWRLVEVGEGKKKKKIFLPIFDPEYFTSGQRELIPQSGDSSSPELYHDGSKILETFAVESWLENQPLCFVGEPGTGKTEGARFIAWSLQLPFTHLQVTEETLPDEFLGSPGFDPEVGTFFKWGRLPRAIQIPGIVLSDEINLGQEAIRQTYRSLNSEAATIFLDGESDAEKHIVRKHKDCFHLLSLNPAWDARNLGASEMADADVSRMSYLYVEEPKDAVIKDIIMAKLGAADLEIDADELEAMMKVRKDIKEMSRSGALPYSWSIRQDVKVAKKLAYYSAPTAYRRTLLDYCSPDVIEMVLKAVQSHFGFSMS